MANLRPLRPLPPNSTQRHAVAPLREVKRRRKILPYAQKLEIVKLIDTGEAKRSVANFFGINESTVRGIYQKREHIKTHMSLVPSVAASNALRSSNQLLLVTEKLLGRYLERQARRNMAVDKCDVMDTAKEIYAGVACKAGVDNPPVFVASKGWVDKYMGRHKVKSVKISGEAASGVTPSLGTQTTQASLCTQKDKQQTDHEEHSQDIFQPSEAFAVTSGCHHGSQENNGTSNPAEAPNTEEGIHSDGENEFLATQKPSQDSTVTTGNHHASEEILSNSESNEGGDAAITVDVVDVELVKEELEGEESVDEDIIECHQKTDTNWTNWTTFKSITGSQMIENQHNSHHCPRLPVPFDSKSREEPKTKEEDQKQGKDPEEVFAEYMKVSLKGLSSKQRRVAKVRMLQVLMECEEADD